MKHPNRLFIAAVAGVALLAMLTGIVLAQGAVSDKLADRQHGDHRGRRDRLE